METASLAVLMITAVSLMTLFTRRFSPTTVLVISNMVIFALTEFVAGRKPLYELGFTIPGSEIWTLVTSMFLHAGFFHLMFNMLYLIAIGFPLESRIGRGRFTAVYLLGGIAGTLIFAALEWSTASGFLVGASGAISALLGAMIMLYPREKIMFFLGPLLTDRFSVQIPIMIWFALQLVFCMLDDSAIAYSAHLGGFAAGAAIAWVIRPNTQTERKHRRDISSLRSLCTTYSLKEMYEYAENARDDETERLWAERILEEVMCPECGERIKMKRNGFECGNGHRIG